MRIGRRLMGARCTICALPEAGAIAERLAARVSVRSVAAELGLSTDALGRHARNHVPRQREDVNGSSLGTPPYAVDDPLAELIAALRGRALDGLPSLAREYRLALQAQADARHAIPPKHDLTSEPEWEALRGRLLAALAPYPKARIAAAAAIAGLSPEPELEAVDVR